MSIHQMINAKSWYGLNGDCARFSKIIRNGQKNIDKSSIIFKQPVNTKYFR